MAAYAAYEPPYCDFGKTFDTYDSGVCELAEWQYREDFSGGEAYWS